MDDEDPGRPSGRHLEARYRRAPRFRVFIGLGVALGVVCAAVLTFSRPALGDYDYGQVLGYTAVAGGLLGGLVGGLVAIVLDWRR